MKSILYLATICLLSCNNNAAQKNNEQKQAVKNTTDVTLPTAESPQKSVAATEISAAILNYPKDPVCGMPMKHDIADTTLYKNKVYGFCAKECKEEFIKNPESFLTQK